MTVTDTQQQYLEAIDTNVGNMETKSAKGMVYIIQQLVTKLLTHSYYCNAI
jgi:hypothetical protein